VIILGDSNNFGKKILILIKE